MSRPALAVLLALLAASPAGTAPHLTQFARLSPPGLARGDGFGATVASGGDATAGTGVVAVAAYQAGQGAGEIFLFRQVGDQWVAFPSDQPAYRGEPGARLGFSLALSADGTTLLVGAPSAAVGGVRCGAVYQIAIDPARGTAGSLGDPLGGADCERGAEIGSAVAIGGNGLIVLIVAGARGADGGAGRVYVKTGGSLVPLSGAATAAGDELGQAVATDGGRVVAGAPFATRDGRSAAGAAFVFTGGGEAGWTATELAPAARSASAAFGYAVAIAGDHIVVGAPLARGEAGEVHVFQSIGEGWAATAPLTAGSGEAQLGVALTAGGGHFYAGARWAGGGRDRGSGAVYPVAVSPPSLEGALRAEPPVAGAEFGFDLAAATGLLVVGAFGEGGTGAAYVFAEPVVQPPQTVTVGLQPASVVVRENAGAVTLTATLTVTTSDGLPPNPAVFVTLSTANGTATAGSDYDKVTRKVRIPVAKTNVWKEISVPLRIPIHSDNLCEGEETFSVDLAVPDGVLLAQDNGKVVVHIEDDTGEITLSPDPLFTTEGGPPVALTVALSCPPTAPVTVTLMTDSTAGSVQPQPATLIFATGTSQPQTVQVQSFANPSCLSILPYHVTAYAMSTDPRYGGHMVTARVNDANDHLRCISGTLQLCVYSDGTVLYAAVLRNDAATTPPAGPASSLIDALPSEVSVVSASADHGVATVDYAGNSVAWSGTVPAFHGPGDEVTIWIVGALAPVSPGTLVRNQGTITFDHPPVEMVPTHDPRLSGSGQPTDFLAGETPCDPLFPYPP